MKQAFRQQNNIIAMMKQQQQNQACTVCDAMDVPGEHLFNMTQRSFNTTKSAHVQPFRTHISPAQLERMKAYSNVYQNSNMNQFNTKLGTAMRL